MKNFHKIIENKRAYRKLKSKKQAILVCILFVSAITLVSFCVSRDNTTERELAQMLSTKINLSLSSMEYYPSSSSAVIDYKCKNSQSRYQLVVFTDSTECTPCFISRISDWKEVTEELFFDSCRSIKMLFIYSPSQSNIQKIKQVVKDTEIDWPIYIDTAYVFLQENKHVPVNRQFHTFLLNDKDEVLCVGNPLYNEKIRNIYKSIIREKK